MKIKKNRLLGNPREFAGISNPIFYTWKIIETSEETI
jgi:hypothetical protein